MASLMYNTYTKYIRIEENTMIKISPIDSIKTVKNGVQKINKMDKSGLPHEMPLIEEKEQKLINMLHPGTPFYRAKQEIQTILNTKFDTFNKG